MINLVTCFLAHHVNKSLVPEQLKGFIIDLPVGLRELPKDLLSSRAIETLSLTLFHSRFSCFEVLERVSCETVFEPE